MVEIYRHAFRYYWSVLPVLLGAMAVLEALLWYLEPSNPTVISTVPTLVVLYQFHRHFLFGERMTWCKPPTGAPPQKFGWFMLISLALILVPAVIGVLVTVMIAPAGTTRSSIYGLIFIVCLPLYLLGLSMFGTALPASVARPGNFRMSSGIKATFGTMGRLILGPGVAQVLLLGVLIVLEYLLKDVPAYQSVAGQLARAVIVTTASFLPSLLGVAVLCHMYQKIMAAEACRQPDAAHQS